MAKALTLHQPWASLIAIGVKTIETRHWSTSYRGPLAIHAGKSTFTGEVVGEWKTFADPLGFLMEHHGTGEAVMLPLGAIVATCELVDVLPMVGPEDTVLPAGSPCIVVDGPTLTWWGTPDYWHNEQDERDVTDQRPYGDFTPGRFAWLLEDIRPVDPPVPCNGRQGLWEWNRG